MSPMKLLIIDDDDDDVILARAALKEVEIVHAPNSQAAIAAIKNAGADFCLVDFSFAESARMVYQCALHGLPAVYWSGAIRAEVNHRMFLSKDGLPGESFRQRLLELIDSEVKK